MLTMYTRTLSALNHSFFLFGPRSTGKTTWLKKRFPSAYWFDLLDTSTYLRLQTNPSLLSQEILALPSSITWIVIDEIQRVPDLLNEVHQVMNEAPDRFKFVLSGSSARKLRRIGTNLLAGRVIEQRFFPLTRAEVGREEFALDDALCYGMLPTVCKDPIHRIRILEAYCRTYLEQEIQQEALTKDVAAFHRFLEVAAIMNSEVLNVSNISRDCAVSRPTVQRYFDILVDTLIGIRVPCWKSKLKVKELEHPKFFFFDTGVVRTLNGTVREPLEKAERGALLETLFLHELRAFTSYHDLGGEISYWRTHSGREVDFIWSRGKRAVGFEIKASTKWRPSWEKGLRELLSNGAIEQAYGVYRGDKQLVSNGIRITPFNELIESFSKIFADFRVG